MFPCSRCRFNLSHHSLGLEIRTQIGVNKQNLAGFSHAIHHKELLLSSQCLNRCKDEICPNFHAKAYTESRCYMTTVCLKRWNIRNTFNSTLLKVPEISPYYLDLGCHIHKNFRRGHHNQNMDENITMKIKSGYFYPALIFLWLHPCYL